MAQTGYTPIQIYNSTTTGNTPSTNVQGELACNITDKKLWIGNGSSNVQLLGTGADVGANNVVAANGVYAKTTMTATYGDGIVLDYTTGTGRFSVGSNDGFAWYNGGVANTQIASMGTDGTLNVPNTFGFKNRIINGAMMIDQRNAGASVSAHSAFVVDRFFIDVSQASKMTCQQSSTAPAGFINSMVYTSSSAYSILSGDYFQFSQFIEGLNVADLAWGTASAAPVTLSFWVRASLTGTYGGSIRNNAINRSYPFTYTINSANTWEQKTITIQGDQSGTWLTTNGIGLRLTFGLGNGSSYSGTAGTWASANYQNATGATSLVGTSGATFYITGVQLEKGSTATSFDYRPYGTELALCQRYYERINYGANGMIATAQAYSTTAAQSPFSWKVTKRAAPSVNISNTGSGYFMIYKADGNISNCTYAFNNITSDCCYITITGATGLVAGNAALLYVDQPNQYIAISSEL